MVSNGAGLHLDPRNSPERSPQGPQAITMEAIKDMASSVIGCLNFTWDYPGNNTDKTMPVLGTAMWIGYPTRKWDFPEEILEK